eukprot:2449825-Alexandrium_andersonii.AAC.1
MAEDGRNIPRAVAPPDCSLEGGEQRFDHRARGVSQHRAHKAAEASRNLQRTKLSRPFRLEHLGNPDQHVY